MESPGGSLWTSSIKYTGAKALAARKSTSANARTDLRFNTGGARLDPAKGGTVTAWIRLDPSTTGGTWSARLELQDGSWAWQGGPSVTLKTGIWTQLTFTPSSALLTGNRGFGVQLSGTPSSTGNVTVQFDEVRQS